VDLPWDQVAQAGQWTQWPVLWGLFAGTCVSLDVSVVYSHMSHSCYTKTTLTITPN